MKSIAVIGAGPSGLAAVKACKEEEINPVCFEKACGIGGLWRYRDDDVEGLASVMKSTIINTHKDMSAFSDFPPPDYYPHYMHHTQMLNYFKMYAEHFGLLDYIRFNTEVISIAKNADYNDTGRWKVRFKSLEDQTILEEVFDGVMVCTGHHVYPNIPKFPGQELFQGKIMHSHSLKNADALRNLNVVVVGIGNSAVDASVEISNVAKQVFLSTRRGAWVVPRCGPRGLPSDALFNCRIINQFCSLMGWKISSSVMQSIVNDWHFDHERYGLKPQHKLLSQHPTINDHLPSKILSGSILIKQNIKKFLKNGVIFEGEEDVRQTDAVIFATGYKIEFPFIAECSLIPKNNIIDLYKLTFPFDMKHPTFAFIGMIQPDGSIFPIAEVQSRWFTLVMNGKVKLPSYKRMKEEILSRRRSMQERFTNSSRHTIQVDFIPFMDDIASQFGAKPNMLKMAFCDPRLFWVCLVGPCFPYQYRLQGPHSWPDARKALLEFPHRFTKPLEGGVSHSKYSCNDVILTFKWHAALLLLILIIVIKLIFLILCWLL